MKFRFALRWKGPAWKNFLLWRNVYIVNIKINFDGKLCAQFHIF